MRRAQQEERGKPGKTRGGRPKAASWGNPSLGNQDLNDEKQTESTEATASRRRGEAGAQAEGNGSGRGRGEQSASLIELVMTGGTEEAVIADLGTARRQDVKQEATKELDPVRVRRRICWLRLSRKRKVT